MPTFEELARDRADWLLDAVAVATQDRRFLRGNPEYDEIAGNAILLNAEKAIDPATIGKAFRDGRAYKRLSAPPVHYRIGPSRGERITALIAYTLSAFILGYFAAQFARAVFG